MSIAISHNMDNITSIGQGDLAKYMGLTKQKNGSAATAADLSDAFSDASNSKVMSVAGNTITYGYRRGGVTLVGTIDVGSQKITWQYMGLNDQTDKNRIEALAQGLKLAQTSDLTLGTTDPFT